MVSEITREFLETGWLNGGGCEMVAMESNASYWSLCVCLILMQTLGQKMDVKEFLAYLKAEIGNFMKTKMSTLRN